MRVAALVVVAAVLSVLAGCPKKLPPTAPPPPPQAQALPVREHSRAPAPETDWRDLARQVRALVVQVEVDAEAPSQVSAPTKNKKAALSEKDPFLAEFYNALDDARRRVARTGTGFFITPAYVLTAYHVVRGARTITLRAPGGSWTAAKLRGADPANDLALLEPDPPASVAPTPLPLAFETPEPGEPLLLAGYPVGLPLSVLSGIVSQVGVPIPALPFEELIQTDFTIHPGLSGAPLVSARGEVVGVALASHTSARSLGYALSSSVIAAVLPHLLQGQSPPDAVWGLSLQWEPGAPAPQIIRVDSGSPAAAAGLSEGDVILEVAEREVQSLEQVQRVLSYHRTSKLVPLLVLRAGERVRFSLGALGESASSEAKN